MQRLWVLAGFNTQPPEGGWIVPLADGGKDEAVSTHSRLKAAGPTGAHTRERPSVSTHSRLKAAGRCWRKNSSAACGVNTQPPEGGWCHTG